MVRAVNRALSILIAAIALLLPGVADVAQAKQWGAARVVSTTSWVEEWDPATQAWVRVDDHADEFDTVAYETTTTVVDARGVTITETIATAPTRFIAKPLRQAGQGAGLVQFGPFRVLDARRAALVASTDATSPGAFAAMLTAYPGLEVIEFVDAPGTNNDLANLELGRAIRAAGLTTHVPGDGSARSGAVELFLAGNKRTIAPGALFAVHSWRDERGREPSDFAPDAPENRLYLDYYAEMGMSADDARSFYALTNSVPHSGALWLEAADMALWIAPHGPSTRALPPQLGPALRQALARSGKALVDAARMGWAIPAQPPAMPGLAYADLGPKNLAVFDTPLLDSWLAFP
ncbi:MAG: alpha/beta hydrolase [Alphaproteobacteria bacterium HGW-Alphaproteobacteria-14]|nr:MAG: alpha/beta hydrolase [Alphaproteobacteria bacterium HGW-Alphaproteobacteria-14]